MNSGHMTVGMPIQKRYTEQRLARTAWFTLPHVYDFGRAVASSPACAHRAAEARAAFRDNGAVCSESMARAALAVSRAPARCPASP
jgi:hypothetical protein